MKTKLFYMAPILIALISSCKTAPQTPPSSTLQGSFTGQFFRIHTPLNSTKSDTLSAIITLTMQPNTNYAVTGDTTTLHAGSHGFFVIGSASDIQFFDVTYPISGTPTKIHLSGQYTYSYDGFVFRLTGYGPLDTLAYKYVLGKN